MNIIPYTPSTYGYLQVNLEHEQLKEKAVRQAITYGLDRQSIYVDANQGAGSIANIPASPISWSYTEEGINQYNYDPEKAKKLLDEAGWTLGASGIREKDGIPLSIHFVGSKNKNTDIFIAVAKENFEALGIKFEPEVFADFNSLVSKVEGGDYDLASFSTPMLTDPSDGLLQFINGEIKGYNNPKLIELYDKGLATTDIEERKEVYKEIYQLLNDELPVIFTSYKKTVYAYNGRIENVIVSPFIGLAGSLPNWSLK
ncbi:Oligopeptide-binding protein AppA precursor [compost metagenome]